MDGSDQEPNHGPLDEPPAQKPIDVTPPAMEPGSIEPRPWPEVFVVVMTISKAADRTSVVILGVGASEADAQSIVRDASAALPIPGSFSVTTTKRRLIGADYIPRRS